MFRCFPAQHNLVYRNTLIIGVGKGAAPFVSNYYSDLRTTVSPLTLIVNAKFLGKFAVSLPPTTPNAKFLGKFAGSLPPTTPQIFRTAAGSERAKFRARCRNYTTMLA